MNAGDEKRRTSSSHAAPRFAFPRGSLLLLLVLVASRLPFLTHPVPTHPDEAAFTAGIGFPADYPVHPPGYPLWVAMGTLLARCGLTRYASYEAWSVLASLAAPVLLYLLLMRMLPGADRSQHAQGGPRPPAANPGEPRADRLAWWLALAFGLNPLVWFHSVAALTYLPATVAALAVVLLVDRAVTTDDRRPLLRGAAILAIGLFLRPDLLLYLGPLVLYAAWRLRSRTAPMIVAAGGLACAAVIAFLYTRHDAAAASRFAHTREVLLGTSVFQLGLLDGLLRNAVKIGANLVWDFGLGVFLLPVTAWTLRRDRRRDRPRFALFALWLAPGGLFLLLMHVVQGYFLILLPAGYLLIGCMLRSRLAPRSATRLAAAVALFSLAQFLFYPWSADSTGFKRLLDAKVAFQSAAGLRHIDQRAKIHHGGDYWPTRAHHRANDTAASPTSRRAPR
ncbi:MAG: hypothetical protein ACE5E1_02815 [Phycisphaerae bacterium]